jgi:hypothetical protein
MTLSCFVDIRLRSALIAALLVFVGFGLSARPGFAQTTGTILGNVTDSSGAVVPGAKVTAVSDQQGLTRSTTTNGTGSYTLVQIPLGTYTVTVEASGFKRFASTTVAVDADQNVRVDASLHPGQVTAEVTVTSAPPQVDTHSNTISFLCQRICCKRIRKRL